MKSRKAVHLSGIALHKNTLKFNSNKAFISSDLGVDQISDFSSGIDKIRFSKKTFTALDNTSNGELIGSNFAVVAVDSLAGDIAVPIQMRYKIIL